MGSYLKQPAQLGTARAVLVYGTFFLNNLYSTVLFNIIQ